MMRASQQFIGFDMTFCLNIFVLLYQATVGVEFSFV